MNTRVAQLLRGNIALALLCAIVIGVLVILIRQPERSGQGAVSTNKNIPAVLQTGTLGAPAAESANGPIAQASFADMPAPKAFQAFTYSGQSALNATGTCADAYEVVMLFSSDADYRVNPGASKYNTAEACARGDSFSKDVDLRSLGLRAGGSYYLIRASEGDSGTWYNPY